MWNRKAVGRKALVIAVALGAPWFVTPVTAQDSEDVPQRIEALQEQVSDLARQQHAFEQQHANDGKNVVTSGATKGSFKLPGSDNVGDARRIREARRRVQQSKRGCL